MTNNKDMIGLLGELATISSTDGMKLTTSKNQTGELTLDELLKRQKENCIKTYAKIMAMVPGKIEDGTKELEHMRLGWNEYDRQLKQRFEGKE